MTAVITSSILAIVTEVTAVLTSNLPVVLGLFGSLVALNIALRLFKKYVGRKA